MGGLTGVHLIIYVRDQAAGATFHSRLLEIGRAGGSEGT